MQETFDFHTPQEVADLQVVLLKGDAVVLKLLGNVASFFLVFDFAVVNQQNHLEALDLVLDKASTNLNQVALLPRLTQLFDAFFDGVQVSDHFGVVL